MSERIGHSEHKGRSSRQRIECPPESYADLGLDQLVAFCVDSILSNNEECTFERLVYECFTRFPKKFGFERYPHWPDSARVNKSWLRCRTDKKWISGSVKAGFVMTPVGKKVAESVASTLKLGTGRKRLVKGEARGKWRAVLDHIRRQPAFRRFKAAGCEPKLTEQEFREVLLSTMETPRRVLRENLSYFEQVAVEYSDEDVSRFLEVCSKSLGGLFDGTRKVAHSERREEDGR